MSNRPAKPQQQGLPLNFANSNREGIVLQGKSAPAAVMLSGQRRWSEKIFLAVGKIVFVPEYELGQQQYG